MATKYETLRELLLKRFLEEEYKNGQQIPTEFELMDEMGYSRNTVRQALKKLEESGVIQKEHGRGSFYVGNKDESSGDGGVRDAKGLIGLVNLFKVDYIYTDIVRGIENTLSENGYSLVISNSETDPAKGVESIKMLLEQGIRGLIFEPSQYQQVEGDQPLYDLISHVDIPVVTTHWNLAGDVFSMVSIDDRKAGRKAAGHFLERGHRNAGIIYRSDVQAGLSRYHGFREAYKDAGYELNDDYVLSFDNNYDIEYEQKSYKLTRELLERSNGEVSAIFYYNDFHAIQGYKAIKEAGLRIPDDISIIGFDDYEPSQLIDPPLTTFMHPKYRLGKWAAKILLEEMESEQPRIPMNLIFEPELIERGSVRNLGRSV